MMDIDKKLEGDKLTVALTGRLDTTTAPDLEKALVLDNVKELVLDLKNLEYISSAGLRIILIAQKAMNTKGSMTLINVKAEVMEIFELTGFDSILHFE